MEKLTGFICLISISSFVAKLIFYMIMHLYLEINNTNENKRKARRRRRQSKSHNCKEELKSKQIV